MVSEIFIVKIDLSKCIYLHWGSFISLFGTRCSCGLSVHCRHLLVSLFFVFFVLYFASQQWYERSPHGSTWTSMLDLSCLFPTGSWSSAASRVLLPRAPGFSPPFPLQQALFLCPAFLSCALQQHSVINGSQLLSPGYLFLQVLMSRDLENLWWGRKLPQS